MDEREFSLFLDSFIEEHKDEILDCLLRFLEIPSVGSPRVPGKPFGPEVDKALCLFVDEAERLGMATKNVDGYAAHAEIGSGEEMAMALTHVDIVPIGSGWTKNPLGEIEDGIVWGRGTQDDKGPTVACLWALKALLAGGVDLVRRVRHVVGGDEESGFRCVRHYFEKEETPTYGFSPDAMFPLVYAEKGNMNVRVEVDLEPGGEGAILLVNLQGGDRANIVAPSAEATLAVPSELEGNVLSELQAGIPEAIRFAGGPGPLEFQFTPSPGQIHIAAKGVAAHASVPWEGTNAIAGLLSLLASLGPKIGSWEGITFAKDAARIDGSGLGIDCEDEISGKLTCNLGIAGVVEGVLRLVYNIRFPVRQLGEDLRARALGFAHPQGSRVQVLSVGKPHHTDPDSFLVRTLLRIYREETGDDSLPMAIGGGTYAKVIPGGVAYGPMRPGQKELAHQTDERIGVDDIMFLVKVYARALFALATAP